MAAIEAGFTIRKSDSKSAARTGVLTIKRSSKNISLLTPGLLSHTELGTPPLLMPDVRDELKTLLHGFLVPLADMMTLLPAKKEANRSLSDFLNIHDQILFAGTRDLIHVSPKSTVSGDEKQEDSGRGRQKISLKKFTDSVHAFQPDVYVSMYDEVPSTTGSKRQRGALLTTLRWLDGCVETKPVNSMLFAPIVGGLDADLRRESAQAASKREIDGYLIAGLGLGESKDQRNEVLRGIIPELDPSLPRTITGIEHYREVVEAVAEGVDIFAAAYPMLLTQFAYAVVIDWSKPEFGTSKQKTQEMSPGGHMKINLRDKRYARDTQPLMSGCECFACRNHNRAYINHLLNAHEMLASILLYYHNLHNYCQFFAAVRDSIEGGSFQDFSKAVKNIY